MADEVVDMKGRKDKEGVGPEFVRTVDGASKRNQNVFLDKGTQ